jgi:acetoin utilization protein AcuB
MFIKEGVTMLVRDWMSKDVITIDADASMNKATKMLKENDIRRLPVIEKKRLVGIITDKDLKEASASDATSLEVHELLYILSKLKIRDIMTSDPITIPHDYTLEETAEILLNNKISGAPVVDQDDQIVGMITETDLFKALISLTGLKKRGIQFAFQLEDRPGSIKEVADVIRKYGGQIASILSTYDDIPDGYRVVYIRMYGIDRASVTEIVKELRAKADLRYMVDLRENRREIYD